MATKEIEVARALVTLDTPPEIIDQINKVLILVDKTEIKNDEQYEKSGDVLDSIAFVGEIVNTHYDSECDRRNKEHKEATAARANAAGPVKDAYRTWQGKIKAYKRVMDDRIAQEQRKLEEEALKKAEDEKVNLAAELEKTGKKVEAEAVIEDTTPPVIVVPKVSAPVASGVTVKKKWEGELVDLKALVVAIASGSAPISLLSLDAKGKTIPIQSNINKFAVATQGGIQVPGIRFTSDDKIGRKRKRGK